MNIIKKLYVIIGLFLIFGVSESYAIIREKVPVYEVSEEFSLCQLLDYIIQKSDSMSNRDNYNAYTIYLAHDDAARIKIVIAMCNDKLLLYGKYIGFFCYDSHNFYVEDCAEDLFEMFFYNAKLSEDEKSISIRSGVVVDGIGPEWVFIIDDSKVYELKYDVNR